MRGLYAIVDTDSLAPRGLAVVDFARALLRAGPALMQLRAKSLGARDTLALLRALRGPCREAGVPLFANDRPDLAVLAGCDGVHLGQSDLDVVDARAFSPALKLGVSSHDAIELERALAVRPDYVAFGPVFATRSKGDPDPVVGIEGLAQASCDARAAGVSLVAIGGIDLQGAAAVAAHADLGAVIAALLPGPSESLEDVTARAGELSRLLGGTG
jgi:thiamine-phosphate pyrophosphorylase